jgi:uncharacterized zinc-type alcohol dehydrogenase-like protein
MSTIKAYAAEKAKSELKPFEYNPGELGNEQVEIQVDYCGICHSDLSMLNNDWGNSTYPIVPGHEVAGKIIALGDNVKALQLGQRVGLGWYSSSCMSCPECMSGSHNTCAEAEGVIVGRHGGFADKVRCHWGWAVPIPEAVDNQVAGPLFCGGITVFNPIIECNVQPTDRVGVVGIGGLGHMALQFLNKWGCHVTAFTSSESKAEQARLLGAHDVVNSRDDKEMKRLTGSLDFILVTVNVSLNWNSYLNALAPHGRFHVVGAVLEPMAVPAFSLISGSKSVSGSPLGSPFNTRKMLEFCSRHEIAPMVEEYPLSKVNEAIEHLESGKARYRIVLRNDF